MCCPRSRGAACCCAALPAEIKSSCRRNGTLLPLGVACSVNLSPVFHHADNGYIDRSAGSRALIDGGWTWKGTCSLAADSRVDNCFAPTVLDPVRIKNTHGGDMSTVTELLKDPASVGV